MEENTNYINYLIELSKNNNENAFINLCEVKLKGIYNICSRVLVDERYVSHTILEIFSEIWRRINDYDTIQSFNSWANDIALTILLKNLESVRQTPPAVPADINEHVDEEAMEKLISALPKEDRFLFVLHEVEGFDYDEISQYLSNTSIDEIKTKLFNIRKEMIEKLGLWSVKK